MSKSTGHPKVDAIEAIKLEGDIVPKSWYFHVCYKTKTGEEKVDLLAIHILADIFYWYRATETRDELSGEIIGYRKKFSEDVLRRSSEDFAKLFNHTPRCIRSSINVLESLGLIVVVRKSITTSYGVLPNVMFIDVCPERISEITYRVIQGKNAETLEKSLLPKCVTSSDEMSNKQRRNEQQAATKCVTSSDEMSNSSIYRDYSKITSEIPTERRVAPQNEKSSLSQNPNIEKTELPLTQIEVIPHESGSADNSEPGNSDLTAIALKDKSSAAPENGFRYGQVEIDDLGEETEQWLTGRRKHQKKGTYLSRSSDLWMESQNNPIEEFAQWVADECYKGKSTPLSNAKSEVRDNCVRARDLWKEFQKEKQDRESAKAQVAATLERSQQFETTETPTFKQWKAPRTKIRGRT